ncbi:maleylpyruvate isomerase family mycothiol-dependent enzyme [Nonomuraea gerenzanensis]|nr:maleylpyruvate isomerase family mycothiol-dependent enzyme [Nonomuraea gerenzanensis]UBU17520.1 maleylpyruvate isomerase family mycothiol-dependent enzyme [Nonomuraea gerenzanensis]
MPTLDFARLVAGLREQTEGFAGAVAGGDPEAVVPTCPEWRLRTLVAHVGQADRWAAELVRKGVPAPAPDPAKVDPGAPAEWGAWLRAGAEELVEAVRKVGPDSEVWSFVGPVPAVFWLRRMCCESAIHHYDAALTTGARYVIADDLAADVITEGAELMTHPRVETFKPELALMRGAGQRLAFRPRGMDGWVISRMPEGLRWERGNGPGDVVVSGTVTEIMLVLSRRAPAAEVSGDRALLEHWLAHSAF